MPHGHSQKSHAIYNSRWRIVAWTGLATGVLAVVCIVAFLLFPDTLVNQFLKGRNIRTFEKTYPEYSLQLAGLSYDISEDRLGCDSVWLAPTDSGFACKLIGFSISDIGWLELLRGQALTPDLLIDSDIDAEAIALTFPRLQYQMSSGRVHISVSDSEIVAENLALRPIAPDEEFFAANQFRKTRYRLDVPHARIVGSACLGMLRRNMYRGRFVQLQSPVLDVLTNKDKPSQADTIAPLMPQELISSIQTAIQIDSLNVVNGTVRYGEQVVIGAKPATITLDSLDAAIGGIANRCCERDSTVIAARGRFMQAGAFRVNMSMPVANPEFSLRCSASLTRMRLDALNPFVVISDHVRVKSGYLEKGELHLRVTAG